MRDSTENKITMAFIRHGETASNRRKSYLGWTDEPLSEDGCEMLLRNRKNYPAADLIFTSPMLRCRQTKEILYKDQPYQIIEKWKEMNFGSFEGKTYFDLNGNEDYQRWIDSGGTLPFPDGESRAEFITRCKAGLLDCLMELEKQVTVQERLSALYMAERLWHFLTVMDRVPILTISAGADRDMNVRCPMQ